MKQSIVFLFVAGLTCARSVQRPSISLFAKILVTNIQPEMVLANSPQFEAFNGADVVAVAAVFVIAVFVIAVAVIAVAVVAVAVVAVAADVAVVAVATVAVADTYLS